jgi:hypothetical protein
MLGLELQEEVVRSSITNGQQLDPAATTPLNGFKTVCLSYL